MEYYIKAVFPDIPKELLIWNFQICLIASLLLKIFLVHSHALKCKILHWAKNEVNLPKCFILFSPAFVSSDDVEFEVAPDRRTGKPIAVKLLKIKPEMLTEERISGQVGPDLHAYPFTELHACINPVKEPHFVLRSVCHFSVFLMDCEFFSRWYSSPPKFFCQIPFISDGNTLKEQIIYIFFKNNRKCWQWAKEQTLICYETLYYFSVCIYIYICL